MHDDCTKNIVPSASSSEEGSTGPADMALFMEDAQPARIRSMPAGRRDQIQGICLFYAISICWSL